MVTITLYARQKKRHRCTEQTFGLYGRRRGWDDLREQHRNMYTIKCETDRQFRLDAWDKCSGLVHWDDPEGWMGRQVGGGLRMGNTCKCVESWLIHVNVWQKPLQYCKVISLQLINIIGKKKKRICLPMQGIQGPSWSGKIPHAPGQLSSCTTSIEPVL